MVDPLVHEFVRSSLPPAPARVLEVGAGSGELARLLAGAGYAVVAIDPGGGDGVVPIPLQDLAEPPASFDAAVAVVSLHHVEPLEPSCRRLADVLRPGGTLVVDEFDVDRFDTLAAAWLIDEWRSAGRERDAEPETLVADMRAELHPFAAIAAALAPWFDLEPPARLSYLHRWDLDPSLRAAEDELIDRGRLPAVGVRTVGIRRSSTS
ncbi:MAG TPA: class I SAM-dependent methyltransferase [Gaiellales bacterium]|jgi:SAM-dependent methyltransferase|nr:class I SAM-dependent methyltransferase [Gaiellales bacterium]